MIATRRLPLLMMILWAAPVALFGALWATVVFAAYRLSGLEALRLPFLPIATVGTAVAFYVGFKNNSSFDRFWEGRKIWGGIVNVSRTWANGVVAYVMPGDDGEEAHALRRALVYRQLAWANALRLQLRRTSRFFDRPAASTKKRLADHASHMRNDWDAELRPFLDDAELAHVSARQNSATHLVHRQARALAELLRAQRIDLFHQIELMGLLTEITTLQGQCERIKNTPTPRQYAEYSRLFTRVFVVMVPLGLLDVFADSVTRASTTAESILPALPMIFSSALITWVFTTMEAIGDASEDPFERSMNDVPMNAICRTIEIDLREILGEKELPAREQPIDHVLY